MAPLRFAALGLHHESNTFARVATDMEAFERAGILRGEQIRARHSDAQTTMAGFLDVHDDQEVVVEPLLFTFPNPRGPIESGAFHQLCEEMLDRLRSRGPWDGVLLAQHGAAVSEELFNADAYITMRVREVVGPAVPIGLAMDLHGNISPSLIDASSVVVVYRTNPHADARIRAQECADLVVRAARGEIRPVQSMIRVPVIPNILCQGTDDQPMRDIYAGIAEVLAWPDMLSASIFQGYPYADGPDMTMSCIAVHDGDHTRAVDAARLLASRVWERRRELIGRALSPDEALRRALEVNNGPAVVLDVGDNIGGGSPGDSTVLLELALQQGVRDYLQSLCDPEAVKACAAAGVEALVTVPVGAKCADSAGRSIEVTGAVIRIDSGRFEDRTPTHAGQRFFDAGPTAVLRLTGGQTIVLHSKLIGNVSLQEYRSLGIEPSRKRVIVAKGVNSPRLAYEPIAAGILFAETPGVTAADFTSFTYLRRPRPLFPFEPDLEWSSSEHR
jgi:microcystin degradation protein MlrC